MILNKSCIYFFIDLNNSYRDIAMTRITNRPVLDIIPLYVVQVTIDIFPRYLFLVNSYYILDVKCLYL